MDSLAVKPWRADIEIDEHLVRELVVTQFPHLLGEDAHLRYVAVGWDNAVWSIDRPGQPSIGLRFPIRHSAVELLERELTFITRLADAVPLPVPAPLHVGTPGENYPFPFTVFELIRGSELGAVTLTAAQERHLAHSVGTFLRALHNDGTRVTRASGVVLPVDPNQRARMDSLVPRALAALAEARAVGVSDAELARAQMLLADTAPVSPDDLVFAHGDLHLRHILVDDEGAPTGVIDWGDACFAPRCLDLGIAWCAWGAPARECFWTAYGPVDPATLHAARVFALFSCAMLAVSAHDMGNGALVAGSMVGLRRALT